MSASAFPPPAYTFERLREILVPNVDIVPAPAEMRILHDVAVAMRDGTRLRANVFLPPGDGPFPVVMCAHPYGKDVLPKHTPLGWMPVLQYRIMRQAGRPRYSQWTSWESPDPAFWTAHGYALVNADLRGFGHSEGTGTLISDAEAQDYYELIEWAAAQPWSTGRVGLNGVSYLALSQWKVAALRPPHLAAICPWEGFSDVYRDFARPGGVREDGFLPFWSMAVARGGRSTYNMRAEQMARPLYDEWWASRCAPLERIDVPALICGSFSDQGLHSRGSFEGYRRSGSASKWLYTHRGGKWSAYYSDEALALQLRFFDAFLKDAPNGMRDEPAVRLEVRSDRDTVRAVRAESSWPPPGTEWAKLYLAAPGRLDENVPASGTASFESPSQTARFAWTVPYDVEIAGPMVAQLDVSLEGAEDATLHVFVRKLVEDRIVPFEGSYGYGYDAVTSGRLKLSLRAVDATNSEPWRPHYPFDREQPLAPGEVVRACVELLPSATFFHAGDVLLLEVRGAWIYGHKNPPIHGPQFYEPGTRATVRLHCGGDDAAHLLVPRRRF